MRSSLILVVAIVLSPLPYRIADAQVSPQAGRSQSPSPSPAPRTTVPAPKQEPEGGEVDPDDVIRVTTTLVTSPALIIGRDKKFVRNLRREDFRIFDEGVEQDIAYFAPTDKPFTVALVIDTSRSMLFGQQDLEDAANTFVDRMRPGDRALIVSFDNQIRVLAEPTSDRVELRKAIKSLRLGGSSRVYDAIDFVLKQRMDQIPGRKALLLFSDGVDNASLTGSRESNLRQAMQSDVLVYPIQFSTYTRLNERSRGKRRALPAGSGFNLTDYLLADAYLHQLASETGVVLYPVTDISDLGEAVASIAEELHNEYSLGYYPKKLGQPGEVRRLEIRVNRPQLEVRARTSYVIDQSGAVTQTARQPSGMAAELSSIGARPVNHSLDPARLPTGARWMCKGRYVRGDFVIVQEGFDSKCPASTRRNDSTNAWFIRQAGPNETVCRGFFMSNGRELESFAIPTGYVVSGEVESPGCARSNNPRRPGNAWRIKLPGPQETVCKGFAIPRGYIVAGETNTASCPAKANGKNALFIMRKRYIENRTIWRIDDP